MSVPDGVASELRVQIDLAEGERLVLREFLGDGSHALLGLLPGLRELINRETELADPLIALGEPADD